MPSELSGSPALPLIDAALRGAVLAALFLIGMALARERRASATARVGVALMAGLAVQTVGAWPPIEQGWPPRWQAPLVGVSIGNSVLFWLFARALFDDAFAPRPWHRALWAAVVGVGAGFCVSLAALGIAAAPTQALRLALRWLPALFAGLVIHAAAAQWRADLVEPRRRLRGFIVIAGTAYTLGMVAVRLGSSDGRLSPAAAGVDSAALFVILAAAGAALLRVADERLFGPRALPAAAPSAAQPLGSVTVDADAPAGATSALDEKIAAGLERLMGRERVYRIDDLTVGLLALKLDVPAYRLRHFINQRLGHRNFNAYVNGWRLAEARAALADPARRGDGVLDIAMEAGFGSIGPFNRAFKADTGVTPTDFRRRALADSSADS